MTTGNKTTLINLYGRREYVTSQGAYGQQNPYGTLSVLKGRRWTGTDNIGYQKLIQQQQSATNSYDLKRFTLAFARPAISELIMDPGATGYSYLKHESYGQGDLTAIPTWDNAMISTLTNRAMYKLYDKLKEFEEPLGALEFIGEFREAIHMMRHPAEALAAYANKRVSDQLNNLKKHKARLAAINNRAYRRPNGRAKAVSRELKSFSKATAASLLEFRFGWEPMVKTLMETAKAATRVFPHKGAVKELKSSSRETVSFVTTQTVGFGNNAYVEVSEDTYEYTVTLKARVAYAGQFDGLSELQSIAAQSDILKLERLIPVLWELAPGSVFVDYFVPVGKVLTAATTATGNVKSVDRYVTRKLLRRKVIQFKQVAFTKSVVERQDGLVVLHYLHYTREKYALSIPDLVVTFPGPRQLQNLGAFLVGVIL